MATNSSPEFEFSTASTNNDAQNHFLSADQLFSHGQILPLDHHSPAINHHSPTTSSTTPNPNPINPNPKPKKWKKLFTSHHSIKNNVNVNGSASQYQYNNISQHELNIHIWPFSRSRSSGNNNGGSSNSTLGRSRSIRKSISAPCSRNNSHGHDGASPKSSGKKWGSLTGGIYVGRNMPVFQLKRKKKNGYVANGSVNVDNGDDEQVNGGEVGGCCGDDEKGSVFNGGGDQIGAVSEDRGIGNGSLFNLRSLFSKKVY